MLNNRKNIVRELELIEEAYKNLNQDHDQNGNADRSAKLMTLEAREDQLLEMLQEFPI
jgi:hypothetical protein